MSRIEEALRRSGVIPGPDATVADEGQQLFVSAWPENKPGTPDDRPPAFVSAWSESKRAAAPQDLFRVAARRSDTARVETPRIIGAAVARGAAPVANRPPRALVDEFNADWKDRLTISQNIPPVFVEQFRRLAATLVQSEGGAARLKLVMVTSAVPADGKTMTALNLSLVLSESYQRRVLLIDADLRRPSMSLATNLSSAEGLSEALKSTDERKAPVIELSEYLTVLPAGRPDPDPLAGLTSARMQRLLEEAAAAFDWVILDAPPVEAVADGKLLAAMVDAVVLVIRAGATQHGAVQRTIDTIGRERILGVVLNGTAEMIGQEHYGYYGAHTE